VLLTEARFTATTGAVVTDEAGRVLLLHHPYRPGSGWGIPGGFMRPGEAPEDALRRELREEIALPIEIRRVAFARTLRRYRQVEIIFLCRPYGDAAKEFPVPQTLEVDRAAWFPLDSLPEGLSDDQHEILRRALSQPADN
jgi:ADP-ribose pyrophosphatase YjhB (NUDIX family)